jgi:transposase
VSSLKTSEWGLSRHRNAPAIAAGGCRRQLLPSLTLPQDEYRWCNPCLWRLPGTSGTWPVTWPEDPGRGRMACLRTWECPGGHGRRMSKARLVITAVVTEGRSQGEAARTYGLSQGWVSRLVARYRAEGEAAFEPRSRRPKTSPSAISDATAEDPQPADLAQLQALIDAFTSYYNTRRHRSLPHRQTPAAAYAARPKAVPGDRAADTHDRVRVRHHRPNRHRHPAPRRPPLPHRHRPDPRRNPHPPAHPGPAHPHHRRRHRRTPPRAHPRPCPQLPAHRPAARTPARNTPPTENPGP